MSAKKGDYIGFTYNNKHSSDLGIVRTSDGSRFNENLLPVVQDKVVPVPGGDGTYYFGSQFSQRQFQVSFAFDSLTEVQVRQLKLFLGDRQVHDLIFDELPYKVYQAKITGSATIKHICFNDPKLGRIYKGEGQIQFTAYQPFAKAKHKFLDDYKDKNIEEWKASSGLAEKSKKYDILTSNRIPLYNPGDMETDWILTVKFVEGKIPKSAIWLDGTSASNRKISFGEMVAQKVRNTGATDSEVRFNSKNNLLEGYYDVRGKKVKSGNLYNQYITGGTFFKIPQTEYTGSGTPVAMNMILDNDANITANLDTTPLVYNYYYF